jgi:hypothetical protein
VSATLAAIGVGELNRPASTPAQAQVREQIVDTDVECRNEGVEIGVQGEASIEVELS